MSTPMRMTPWLGLTAIVLVLAGAAAVRTGTVASKQWQGVESTLLDTWFRLRGPQPTQDAVVVVEVDDATIEAHPKLTERRDAVGELLTAIRKAGASAIAIDLLFTDPEELIPQPLAGDIQAWSKQPEPGTPDRAVQLLARADEVTRGDERLAAVLAEQDVLLAFHIGNVGRSLEEQKLTRGAYGQVVPGGDLPESKPNALSSLPIFNKAAKRLGYITVHELAGQLRQVPLVIRSGPRHYVPLGVQMAAHRMGVSRGRMVYAGDQDTVRLGDRELVGDDHQLWLNWRGPGAIERVSAKDVLAGKVDIRGRMAIIGFSYLSLDSMKTPWGGRPAVLTHATLMENVLAQDLLHRAPLWLELLWALLCGSLVLSGFLVRGARGLRFVGTVLGAAFAVGGPAVAFFGFTLWLPAVGAVLAVLATTLVCFVASWVEEGSQARALRRAFSHYVSDDLLDAMVADPSLVQLGGQRRELSVLFSDIRNFTTYSERIEPLDLIGFLNHYLTPMTKAVLDNRGFVDKFIGDAVMALFGAPVPDEDHAVAACRTALDMYVALEGVQPEAQRHGIDLQIGVGVNSGEVAVGNMGSEDRFEYTVLGDAVNLAARLEGLTKTYGVFCLLGQNTVAALTPAFRVRALDLVRVKGKKEPVEIYELCGDDRVSLSTYSGLDDWTTGVAAWRSGDFSAARAAFEQFAAGNPEDPVCRLYLERLGLLTSAPEGWDGVFTHTKK